MNDANGKPVVFGVEVEVEVVMMDAPGEAPSGFYWSTGPEVDRRGVPTGRLIRCLHCVDGG